MRCLCGRSLGLHMRSSCEELCPPQSEITRQQAASSDEVVACSRGTSNFWTVASDSPNWLRSFAAVFPRLFKTFSLLLAVACSSPSGSPDLQFTAFKLNTYCVPRLAIDPAIYTCRNGHKARAQSPELAWSPSAAS